VFCSLDGERLTSTAGPKPAVSPRGGRCPRCQRTYAAGLRYCPVDADELQPLGEVRHETDSLDPDHDHLVGGDGKICPMCASHYALEAQVCGRDGSELVTIN
jgi:hypothetical protein